jgi:AbiV family abortive infection protein
MASIEASIANGARLLEESYDLEFRKPPSSRYYLILIAQEEFAKAFILYLVREGVAPFNVPVQRAINDHASKQLVGMVLDYMIMHWEELEELQAAINADVELGDRLPNDIGSALELLIYEKIGRWGGNHWSWVEDPKYDVKAMKIAEGKKDQKKQDALYIRIGRDGRPCSSPSAISEDETQIELERADRYCHFMKNTMENSNQSHRFLKVLGAFRTLFVYAQPRTPSG